jgi:methionyl-tRNA formyltransferase
MRVIFMGTPTFAVPALQALIDSHHEVVAVYSQPPRPAGRGMKLTPSPVHQLAAAHPIPVFTPPSLKPADAQAEFASHAADIAVVAAYGLLLPQPILDASKHGCINIHPSDLPRWRGAAPLQRTIIAGDTSTACCIMQMDAGLDTGDVILRQPFPILDGMHFGALHDAMAQAGATLTLQALQQIENGTAVRTAQPKEGVYAAKLTKQDQPLDFTQPAASVRQHVLGLSPAPGATAAINGEIIKIFNAVLERGDAGKPAGTLLDDRLLVNCGDGQGLRLTELQRPGKSRQDAIAFLQGFPVASGSLFGLPNS